MTKRGPASKYAVVVSTDVRRTSITNSVPKFGQAVMINSSKHIGSPC